MLSRHSVHGVKRGFDDVDVEYYWSWKFHWMELCLWDPNIWNSKGLIEQLRLIFIQLTPVQALKLFRVNEAHEIQGLDVVKHNEPVYPIGRAMYY